MPKIIDNVFATTRYNFDAPINQAGEEGDEDLKLSEEMAQEIERKPDNIEKYQEAIETINLSTEEDLK